MSKVSAVAMGWTVGSSPPVTRTSPVASSVAVGEARRTVMVPVAENVPVAGS